MEVFKWVLAGIALVAYIINIIRQIEEENINGALGWICCIILWLSIVMRWV